MKRWYPDNSPPGRFAPDNSPPGQFASDNSPPIFKQLAPSSFIHYRAKRAAKYMNPRLNVIQIILRSFIHYRTKYSSFFYPLPSLKIGGVLSGAYCPGGELSDYQSVCALFHLASGRKSLSFNLHCGRFYQGNAITLTN